MNKNIKSIIDDLQQIDPSLKKRVKDLEKLVEKLIEAKPNIKMDKIFIRNLRRSLSAKADEIMEKYPQKFGFLNFLYAFGGTVMALVIVISIFGQNKVRVPIPSGTLEFNINEIVEEAPSEINIEVAPIIKTQNLIEEQLKDYGETMDNQSIKPQEYSIEINNPSTKRSIDDFGESTEESVGTASSAVFFDTPMSGVVETVPDEPEIDPYYLDLLEMCESKSKPDCCKSSVEKMISGGYLLMTADGCPNGFKIGMLNCGSDIRWCEME